MGSLFEFLLSGFTWMQASVVAEKAAKSIAEIQNVDEDSESTKGEEEQEESESDKDTEAEDETEKIRKSALDKLENASEDSLLGQASFACIFAVLN